MARQLPRVEAANRAATREPSSAGYLNAVQVYPWTDGALYRLYAAPERVSDLPGGGRRTIRRPVGVHGVYVNGVEVYGENGYASLDSGPGQVLDRFSPSRNNRATA